MHWWEWTFSGVGAVFVAYLIPKLSGTNQNKSPRKDVQTDRRINNGTDLSVEVSKILASSMIASAEPLTHTASEFSSTPTLCDIGNALRKMAPYQRNLVGNSYIGLKVDWDLTFFSINSENERKTSISAIDESCTGSPSTIFFEIDLESYPRFKVLHKGSVLQIKGTITEIRPTWIDLDVESIIFLEDVLKPISS